MEQTRPIKSLLSGAGFTYALCTFEGHEGNSFTVLQLIHPDQVYGVGESMEKLVEIDFHSVYLR